MSSDTDSTMKILAIGDSFVQGVGDELGGWATRLGELDGFEVTQAGVAGNTVFDVLKRLPTAAEGHWQLGLLGVGLNDSRWKSLSGNNETPIEQYKTGLAEIISGLQLVCDSVAVLGLPQLDEAKTSPWRADWHYLNSYIAQYDLAVREVTTTCGVDYVPVSSLTRPGLIASDGLHPSAEGHQLILQSVLEYLA
jgi:lysophospholipase L1-like esterase